MLKSRKSKMAAIDMYLGGSGILAQIGRYKTPKCAIIYFNRIHNNDHSMNYIKFGLKKT